MKQFNNITIPLFLIFTIIFMSNLSESFASETYDGDGDLILRLSGANGEIFTNCEKFSYSIFLDIGTKYREKITLVEIIDPDRNVIFSRGITVNFSYKELRNIEVNWGVHGTYLVQVHINGKIYEEDFSYGPTPESTKSHRTDCLYREYIKSVNQNYSQWLDSERYDSLTQKNINIVDELVYKSDSKDLIDIFSKENINELKNYNEKHIRNYEKIMPMFGNLTSVISNLAEQRVIQIFQENEDKLIDNPNLTLDEKTELIFKLRELIDNKIIGQKENAEDYVWGVTKLYAYARDYDKRQELLHEHIRQKNELISQIERDKESIKQEILSTQSYHVPEWIKNNAREWSKVQVDDDVFVEGIQHLIKEKIINISDFYEQAHKKTRPTFVDESKNPQSYVDRYNNEENYKEWFDANYPDYTIEEAVGITAPIPGWIKNTASWWSEGLISEDEFIKGIEFLVEKRILNVN